MKKIFVFFICLIIYSNVLAQKKYVLSGYITDKQTGEALIGATIVETSTYKGTATNGYGFYSLTLPQGINKITISYMGYNTITKDVNLNANLNYPIALNPSSTNLEEIVIDSDNKNNPLKTNEFNIEQLSIKSIKNLPSLFGETDVIKAIQLQSGVKTIGDGSSAMFIRGGGSDQNLILIDEAPIYNPSHCFGLISVFNSDALNHVTLYKSNMPANYGGRVSSVIDCKMKEGNLNNYDYSAGVSIFSAVATVNGPIVKEKSSFLASIRKSWIDMAFEPGGEFPLVPGFYDLNLKFNTKLGNRDRLFISFYSGKDKIESDQNLLNKWGNITTTIRWNRNITEKIFSKVSLIYSDYNNSMQFNGTNRNYKWLTGLKDINGKIDLSYFINSDNKVMFGVGSIYHRFIPGETADTLDNISRVQAFEHSAYILNDVKLFNRLGINYGLRFSAFQNDGKANWYLFDNNYSVIGEKKNKHGIYNSYWRFEPRISINYQINGNNSFKLAYDHNIQYMQVLQNSSLSYTSLETWFPATCNTKPIVCDVASVGWFYKFLNNYFLSIEAYYKWYQNQIDYVDNACLINNPYIEAEIRSGTARAYGIEFLLKKGIGKFTGNISYSYSRALRKINDINDNNKYSSPYDIPHDFKITGNYQLTSKLNVSAVWLYSTGRPVTLPTGFYYSDGDLVPIYSARNASRFPNYHRMDIAFNYSTKTGLKKKYWDIALGVFNVYGKKNPLGYSFETVNKKVVVTQTTLFTIMPNFSVKKIF